MCSEENAHTKAFRTLCRRAGESDCWVLLALAYREEEWLVGWLVGWYLSLTSIPRGEKCQSVCHLPLPPPFSCPQLLYNSIAVCRVLFFHPHEAKHTLQLAPETQVLLGGCSFSGGTGGGNDGTLWRGGHVYAADLGDRGGAEVRQLKVLLRHRRRWHHR